jgi:hypothetical protein
VGVLLLAAASTAWIRLARRRRSPDE